MYSLFKSMHEVLGRSLIITAGGMAEAGVKDTESLVEARLLAVQHLLLAPQHRVHLSQEPHLLVTQCLQMAAD